MIRSIRRRALLGLAALAVVALAACSGHTASFSGGGGGGGGSGGSSGGSGSKSVSIAVVAGWDEDVAATYMWKQLLEDHGYTVKVQELDIASTFTGVANGQIDMYLDAWLPYTHAAYWNRFENKLEVLTTWSIGKNVLVVPDYSNVNSIADLKDNKSEFGGRIVGIEAGAGEMKAVRTKVMPTYGLTNFDLVEGSSPAMLAALDTAIKGKKPVVVTLWQPHWAFTRWQLKPLEDPLDAWGKPDNMQIIATKGFSQSHPEVAGWLKKFTMKSDQLAGLMFKLHELGQGKEQAGAKQWIGENKALVDSWLGGS